MISDVKTLELKTEKKFQLIDVTQEVKKFFETSGIENGSLKVFSPHTTCSVKINEKETSLLHDFENFLDKLAPKQQGYGHDETCVDDRPNTHSHLRSLILNSSESIPVKDKKMLLGGWQTIFFIELDGPRDKRKMIMQIIGE